jgi:hypothetical protein
MVSNGRGEGSAMKTEQEIRERIAMRQREVENVEEFGGKGSEDWCAAKAAIRELGWVLDEVTEKERA